MNECEYGVDDVSSVCIVPGSTRQPTLQDNNLNRGSVTQEKEHVEGQHGNVSRDEHHV